MARWGFMFFVALLVSSEVTARVLPGDNGLNDQKNFLSFGGAGSYAGVGSNGVPFGGVFGGAGNGGIGGTPLSGVGGVIGTGPNGPVTQIGSIGGVPGGVGGGAGSLPHP
ncbi:hypothetical protein CDL12_23189 [Handroanthus impetiginosus]|uniref:Uncharacterized protein n=1 Tax=Handroanthus impetiginosus TaxID=429701 RepID=A0A2G9GDE9_9LAMI|nr:hypothetical protein CDL12_24165 [Handroanthus impetiginosus]PIN04270.1 hypothetical protein CDL12_23189 [Handroanthus impetiginosus]